MVNLHSAIRVPAAALVRSGTRTGPALTAKAAAKAVDRSPGTFSDTLSHATLPVASSKSVAASKLGATLSSVSGLTPVPPVRTSTPASQNSGASQVVVSTPVDTAQTPVRATTTAATAPAKIGFNALVPAAGVVGTAGAGSTAPAQHWYGADAADDAYWAKQPAAVQQLREIDDTQQRTELATTLAGQGYQIDVPIMVWGWDAAKTMALRQSGGYSWVPSALQSNVTAAPGVTAPGLTPYDPYNPPSGSIHVG